MAINTEAYARLKSKLNSTGVTLVAVSKTKSEEDILALYNLGQRDFGENYVQELIKKHESLPKDIRWHFIGHLQSNKVKLIAPFVYLIHGVDSIKLLETINKEGEKNSRKIKCLLQVHIAKEETKFGFDLIEARQAITHVFVETSFSNIELCGLMGMASFTANQEEVRHEFSSLKSLHEEIRSRVDVDKNSFSILSMGMSGDYELAISEGSNLIRVGSMLFGARG